MATDIQLTAYVDTNSEAVTDLLIANGDFAVNGSSDQQHQQDIISSRQNSWFQYPQLGVFIKQYLDAKLTNADLYTILYQQLKNDGYTIKYLNINSVTATEIDINIQAVRQ